MLGMIMLRLTQLDELSAIAISMYSKNPDYGKLASRIVVSNRHKELYPYFQML